MLSYVIEVKISIFKIFALILEGVVYVRKCYFKTWI